MSHYKLQGESPPFRRPCLQFLRRIRSRAYQT